MYDLKNINVETATIATIIVPGAESRYMVPKGLEGVLSRPITISQGPTGLIASSQRDQIEAIIGANKIDVRGLSGNTVFADSKIPKVLHFILGDPPPEIMSYGVNFIISVDCVEPKKWLIENLLSRAIGEKTGLVLIDGTGSMTLVSDEKKWNIRFVAGDGDFVTVNFNASEAVASLPTEDKLAEELQVQFNKLMEFLTKLGLCAIADGE